MEERTEPINLWKKMFSVFFFNNFKFYLFIGSAESSLLHRLFSSCGTQASHCCGFSCCRAQTVRAQRISSFSSSALEQRFSSRGAWHVRSSWIRDWTHISCTGRGILYHSATKEVLSCIFDALEFELCSPWRDYHLKDRDSKGPPLYACLWHRNQPGRAHTQTISCIKLSPTKPILRLPQVIPGTGWLGTTLQPRACCNY